MLSQPIRACADEELGLRFQTRSPMGRLWGGRIERLAGCAEYTGLTLCAQGRRDRQRTPRMVDDSYYVAVSHSLLPFLPFFSATFAQGLVSIHPWSSPSYPHPAAPPLPV